MTADVPTRANANTTAARPVTRQTLRAVTRATSEPLMSEPLSAKHSSSAEVVPVAPLVQEVVAAVLAKGTCPVELHMGAALPDLRGDRMLLREALLNIVSNAAEACSAGGGQVTVRARAIVVPGGSNAPAR